MGADFYRVVDQVKNVLGANPLVMTFQSVSKTISLVLLTYLNRKAYVWDDSGLPENYEVQDIPADMVDKVEEYREN